MKNTEMVSVPRHTLENVLNDGSCKAEVHAEFIQARNDIERLLAQPAEQHQGEFVGYCRAENIERMRKGDLSGFMVEDEPSATVNTPLYTRLAADPGEVERLRAEVNRLELSVSQSDYSYDMDRDHMRNRIDLLEGLVRKFVRNCEKHQLHHSDHPALSGVRWYLKRFETALSASAEPSAPKCSACNDTGVIDDKEKDELPSGHYVERGLVACKQCEEPSAPVERDERAAFNAYLNEVVIEDRTDRGLTKIQRHQLLSVDVERIALEAWQARAPLERKP